MTVAEAKSELNGEYCLVLSKAPFDINGCDTCAYRSRNQTVLFPDLKKTDECTDKNCYRIKSKQHYLVILKEKEAAGFKILTDKEKIKKFLNAKGSCEIYPPGSDSWKTIPKKYKSECAKCKENHVFYLIEDEDYSGLIFRFGEICLDRKCLDKMQRQGKKEERASGEVFGEEGAAAPGTAAQKARDCRDRFLLRVLSPRVEASSVLQKRLALSHLIEKFMGYSSLGKLRGEFIREYYPAYKEDDGFDFEIYEGIREISAKCLDEAIAKLIILTFRETDPDVMLRMLPEAGVDIKKEFTLDVEFINDKTKDEIRALVEELWPKKVRPPELTEILKDGGAKKDELVSTILAHASVGLMPKEIAEVFKEKEDEKR